MYIHTYIYIHTHTATRPVSIPLEGMYVEGEHVHTRRAIHTPSFPEHREARSSMKVMHLCACMCVHVCVYMCVCICMYVCKEPYILQVFPSIEKQEAP